MTLKTRHHRKSRPMVNQVEHQNNFDKKLAIYHLNSCKAVAFIVFKIPVYYFIICGTWILLTALFKAAIFFVKGFQSLANWIFCGPKKREEIFFKGYAMVLGLMIGTLPNAIWINVQDDIRYAYAMRQQAPALEQMIVEHTSMRTEIASYKQESGEALFNEVLSTEVSRLPISCSAEDATAGLRNFANFVVQLESKGDQFAVSSSGAVSYTQFLRTYRGRFDRGPMDTGLNRWASYTDRNSIDQNTQWFERKNLRQNPYRFMGIPLEAQQAFMLVNITEERNKSRQLVNTQNLADVACGDARAAVHLYVYKHHRDPGKEKWIWENIEDKIPAFYPNHQLNLSLGENSLKAS